MGGLSKRKHKKKGRNKMSIGENIKRLRVEKGITQKVLADELGIDRTTIAQYESGVLIPNMLTGKTIAEVLGVEVEHLYE